MERSTSRPSKTTLLAISLAALALGAAVAGAGVLAGGDTALYLPEFLRAVLANE